MSIFDFFKKKRITNVHINNEDGNYRIYKEYDPHEQHVRIINESFDLIGKTLNPETYYSRCRLISNEAIHISGYHGLLANGKTADETYRMFNDEKTCAEMDIKFIDRLFENGREDNMIYQYYDSVAYRISRKGKEYLLKKLVNRTYHFCKVRFNMQGKEYTYITRDKSVAIGDTVTVPTGNKFKHETTVLQVCDAYDAPLKDIPFDIENLRCIERKLKSVTCPHCGGSLILSPDQKTGKCEHCNTEFYFL